VHGRTMSMLARVAMAAVVGAAASGCGASPITPARIEAAIAPTFANLVHLQVSWMGLPPMAASEFAARASRRRPGTTNHSAGSGEWVCMLVWQGPDGQPLRDTFDLFVTTDGCYTATAAAETLGGPTLKASNGSEVRNLLYTFEGCFDTT
jgi:hypothetical protein